MKLKRKAVEIVGVVHPMTAGGGRQGNETLWTLRFSVQPWRRPDGEIDERRLRLHKPKLSDEQLGELTDHIDPYDILRLRVRFAEEKPGASEAEAQLVELVGVEASDQELARRVKQLRKPFKLAHPYFGTLSLDRAVNWYQAAVKWNGKKIRLYLSRNECKDEEALLRMAEGLCKKQKKWDQRMLNFAVQELLELKNDLWLGETEKEFSAQRFKKRMTLKSILLDPDGTFEFTYADGNLFWGHVIQVGGTLAEGPTYATIAG